MYTYIYIYIQWRIQGLSDAGIPVWAPELGAQIKGELMQNNISHLIIFNANASTRSQKFKSNSQKWWITDLVYAWVCNSSLCKSITIYRLYKRIQHFRSTGVP